MAQAGAPGRWTVSLSVLVMTCSRSGRLKIQVLDRRPPTKPDPTIGCRLGESTKAVSLRYLNELGNGSTASRGSVSASGVSIVAGKKEHWAAVSAAAQPKRPAEVKKGVLAGKEMSVLDFDFHT